MSGGHYDYAYERIDDLVCRIERTTPLRKAFVRHLVKVAKAAHDIEWVDSNDNSPGHENAAIREVLGPTADAQVLAVAVEDAKAAMEQLKDAIAGAEMGKEGDEKK